MRREEVKMLATVILSAYLAYIGIDLIRAYDPSKSRFYQIAGIFFVAFGILCLIWYIRRFILVRRERIRLEEKEKEMSAEKTEEESDQEKTGSEKPAQEEMDDEK